MKTPDPRKIQIIAFAASNAMTHLAAAFNALSSAAEHVSEACDHIASTSENFKDSKKKP